MIKKFLLYNKIIINPCERFVCFITFQQLHFEIYHINIFIYFLSKMYTTKQKKEETYTIGYTKIKK